MAVTGAIINSTINDNAEDLRQVQDSPPSTDEDIILQKNYKLVQGLQSCKRIMRFALEYPEKT